jgi:hypothetical protein
MDKSLEDILDDLEKMIDAVRQPTLIGPSYDTLDSVCAEWLKARGYGVMPPQETSLKTLLSLDDLILLFHNLYTMKFSDHIGLPRSEQHERKIAKAFVEARMAASGKSKQAAIQECALIIRTVFNNLKEFEFNVPLTFGMFGQGKMAWVTEKAVQLINKQQDDEERRRLDLDSDRIIKEREAAGHRPGWFSNEMIKAEDKEDGKKENKEKS